LRGRVGEKGKEREERGRRRREKNPLSKCLRTGLI